MAADPDPYFSFPALVGAPAYARAPKAIPDAERPFDPDDLPIAAHQTEDERAITQALQPSLPRGGGNGLHALASGGHNGSDSNGSIGSGGVPARRFSLRAFTDRRGPRDK